MFFEVSLLASDQDFMARCIACAALENVPTPDVWATDRRWQLAATPGFGDKYASAIANNVENPGRDTSVISDADITSAVQAMGAPTTKPS